MGKRIKLILATVLLAISTISIFQGQNTYAAQLTGRRLTLQAGATATEGGSKPSGLVKHFFEFTIPGGGNVGSIQFLYCQTAGGTCNKPTGLSTTSATLGSESGFTGFTMVNTTDGAPYLTKTPASVTAQAVSYQLATITNPSTANETFYVRISTFISEDATGGATDTGVVAASTATQIVLTGTMPESLIFCTGEEISVTSTVPDCSTATAGAISFNQLFSPADTATATSQMAASTNAGAGYVITVNGPTLTSGLNTITAMGAATAGVRGLSQFGMNLKLNTTDTSTPAVGLEVDPAANGTNFKGQALTGYNTEDVFKFTSGDSVADSANGGAGSTDSQIFTVSYIVNVSGSQAAGTYTTTLTYICTPTF